jgi:hypothetical protein
MRAARETQERRLAEMAKEAENDPDAIKKKHEAEVCGGGAGAGVMVGRGGHGARVCCWVRVVVVADESRWCRASARASRRTDTAGETRSKMVRWHGARVRDLLTSPCAAGRGRPAWLQAEPQGALPAREQVNTQRCIHTVSSSLCAMAARVGSASAAKDVAIWEQQRRIRAPPLRPAAKFPACTAGRVPVAW